MKIPLLALGLALASTCFADTNYTLANETTISVDDRNTTIGYAPVACWVTKRDQPSSFGLYGNSETSCSTVGSFFQLSFIGISIEYWSPTGPSYGPCKVVLDNEDFGNVTAYSSTTGSPKAIFTRGELDPKKQHQIVVYVSAPNATCSLDRLVYGVVPKGQGPGSSSPGLSHLVKVLIGVGVAVVFIGLIAYRYFKHYVAKYAAAKAATDARLRFEKNQGDIPTITPRPTSTRPTSVRPTPTPTPTPYPIPTQEYRPRPRPQPDSTLYSPPPEQHAFPIQMPQPHIQSRFTPGLTQSTTHYPPPVHSPAPSHNLAFPDSFTPAAPLPARGPTERLGGETEPSSIPYKAVYVPPSTSSPASGSGLPIASSSTPTAAPKTSPAVISPPESAEVHPHPPVALASDDNDVSRDDPPPTYTLISSPGEE